MTEPSEAVRAYLKGASPRFREIHASLARAVREIFPEAEIAFQFKMPGWRIPRLPRRVDLKSVRGTLDPNWAQIYVVERKSGITLNLWNPVDFNGFRKHRTELERAGFKLMVGCIRFNRKSEYPTDLVVGLFKDIRISLDEDARSRAGKAKGDTPVTAQGGRESKDEALRRQLDEWASEPPMDGGD